MGLLRFIGGVFFLALAASSAMPASNGLLWKASVAATEWGYWLAFAALLPLIPSPTGKRIGRIGGLFSLGAIALFCLPVVRARQMNQELPAAFDARFGAERRVRSQFSEDPRAEPLVLTELLRPVQSREVRFEERVFGTYDDRPLTLDIYRPGYVHGPLPALIVVHGGMWQSGDNSGFLGLNAYLAARDYVVAAVNYRLAPKWPFPAARDDVLSAIAYLKVHAGSLGIDPARLALLGRASGGQLALLAAYTANEPAIRGVISLYGPSDLKYAYDHPAPVKVVNTRAALESFLGGPPPKEGGDGEPPVDDPYFAASPVNFVNAASPPTLLIHGMRDVVVSPGESELLETRLQQAGVKHLFVRLPWATHGCDKSFAGPCGQIATYAVERFLDAVMIAPPAPPPARPRDRVAARVKQVR
jgi:acetyl esterase/lipase